ncbi:hypothetical protein M404DRAFT_35025 [Pisolithus tinctorius Marx 270]|uniref:Uncharacterized protein n=1 Tax=Pisolithus tinctorius Marx 270 TaxID=870435 RepID=A0A0C3NFC2_PISTI|nr:hypothetical protein M404DRAFT_35025 [Pisolithus tinctorius Marx 270]
MEIGAAHFPPRPVPSHIKCFDCQGNHYKRDCPRAKGKGPAKPSIREDIFNSEITVPSEEATPVGTATDVKLSVLNSSCDKNKNTPTQKTKETPKIRTTDPKAELELEVVLEGREKKWSVKALVDSGANNTFLDKKWADENDVLLIKLG